MLRFRSQEGRSLKATRHRRSDRLSSVHLRSDRLTSAHLSSPQLSSPQISSLQLSSPYLSSLRLSSAQLTSPQLSSLQLSSAQLTSKSLTSANSSPSLTQTVLGHFARIILKRFVSLLDLGFVLPYLGHLTRSREYIIQRRSIKEGVEKKPMASQKSRGR